MDTVLIDFSPSRKPLFLHQSAFESNLESGDTVCFDLSVHLDSVPTVLEHLNLRKKEKGIR